MFWVHPGRAANDLGAYLWFTEGSSERSARVLTMAHLSYLYHSQKSYLNDLEAREQLLHLVRSGDATAASCRRIARLSAVLYDPPRRRSSVLSPPLSRLRCVQTTNQCQQWRPTTFSVLFQRGSVNLADNFEYTNISLSASVNHTLKLILSNLST